MALRLVHRIGFDDLVEAFDGNVFKKNITVLGAAFKPHSDDIRDSPGLDIRRPI